MFRPCVLIPTYDNPATIERVVARARTFLPAVIVVDDGSHEPARSVVQRLGARGLAHVHRREANGGKGAAVKDGFRVARSLGYTHALQLDADDQHTVEDIPRFLDAAMGHPTALVLGAPVFDASAPSGRLQARRISQFWANVETLGRVIADPLCGFRVYPLDAAIAAGARGDAMDFDPEIAVRMHWQGTPILNLPTRVRYVAREAGGVSHFRLFWDNVFISWMHTRMMLALLARLARGRHREGRAP